MPLDRQSIEKRDFPIARRGYDPDAVDAHLRSLADQIELLREQREPRQESLALTASERVRAIVEAAESAAEAINREADQEARTTRELAADEAERARDEASRQSREHVAAVSSATQEMRARIDSINSELLTVVQAMRGGATQVEGDLQLLQERVGEVGLQLDSGVSERSERRSLEAPRREPAAAIPEPEPAPVYEDEPDEHELPPATVGDIQLESGEEVSVAERVEQSDEDLAGARLVALNMALDGKSRVETEDYLDEHYSLVDLDDLLDDVFERAGR